MRKYARVISLILLIAMLAVFAASSPVLAKDKTEGALPEENGVYDVPNHPELKVRVFVHRVKPAQAPQTSAPVCGLTDPDSDAVVASAGWHLPSSVGYYLNVSTVPSGVGSGNWLTIAQNSFAAWADPAVPAPQYIGTTSINRAARDYKNILSWGRASNSALAITYTWYNSVTHLAVETDTIMNQKYAWKWSNPATWPAIPGETCAITNSYDAQNILTHELGHWFGLNDHYTVEYANNTMYGYGSQKETKKDSLTTGDVMGLRNIYSL